MAEENKVLSLRNVYLIAGHSIDPREDRGAVNGDLVEGVEAWDFVNTALIRHPFLKTDDSMNFLAETIRWFRGKAKEKDILIEVHFNASNNELATGVECIVQDDANELELKMSEYLNKTTATILGIKNRGIKKEGQTPRKRLGFFRIPSNTVIWEVCFISNLKDMASYQKNRDTLINHLAVFQNLQF